MYTDYFGLREKPFKLIPNPEFLFLGKSHEEALAHLLYATSQGDGFVEITGEVGTGKTTLCRVFLEDLGEEADIAYIFNSKIGAAQLLKAIHGELGIPVLSEDPIELTNTLNQFLLKKRSEGRSVILLIDEAQHLGAETLEQLRLLSNLETTKNKLLQIILVGQPELGEILDAFDMRQLRQRISLSCHIFPLTKEETGEYIDHRIKIAGGGVRSLFSKKAKQLIYANTRGVPRRINIVCERALLTAYTLGKEDITTSTVKSALRELEPPRHNLPQTAGYVRTALWTVVVLLLATSLLFLSSRYRSLPVLKNNGSSTETQQVSNQPISMAIPHPEQTGAAEPKEGTLPVNSAGTEMPVSIKSEPGISEPMVMEQLLPSTRTSPTIPASAFSETKLTPPGHPAGLGRRSAADHVLSLWDGNSSAAGQALDLLTDQVGPDNDFFRLAGMQNSLLFIHIKNDLNRVESFNFPAVLELAGKKSNEKKYIILIGITADSKEYTILHDKDGPPLQTAKKGLLPLLTGEAFVTCKNPFGYAGVIAESSPKFSVLSIKLLLNRMGYGPLELTPAYGEPLKNIIARIQTQYGLDADGLVGPETKLVLIREENKPTTPFLTPNSPFQSHKGGMR